MGGSFIVHRSVDRNSSVGLCTDRLYTKNSIQNIKFCFEVNNLSVAFNKSELSFKATYLMSRISFAIPQKDPDIYTMLLIMEKLQNSRP